MYKNVFPLLLLFGFNACSMVDFTSQLEKAYLEEQKQSPKPPSSEDPTPPVITPPSTRDTFRYGKSLLKNIEELKAYEEILKSFQNWEDNRDIYSDVHHRTFVSLASKGIRIDRTQTSSILSHISLDNPQFYNARTSAPRSITFSDGYVNTFYTLTMGGTVSRTEFDAASLLIELKSDQLLAGITDTMTEAQKVRLIHDRFLASVSYSMSPLYKTSSLHGALIDGKAICEGYAEAFLYLLQKAGLKALYTAGYLLTDSTQNTWGAHAWVVVQVNGQWYNIDITSNDGMMGTGFHHDYFLLGSEDSARVLKYKHNDVDLKSYPIMPQLSRTRFPLINTSL